MYCEYLATSVGILKIGATQDSITSIRRVQVRDNEAKTNDVIQQCVSELTAYFSGKATNFTVPMDTTSGTKFYKSVWNEVSKVPYGDTMSYMEIAHAINNPGAIRAVGMANGKNPLPILIPCHRIIGSNGSLTGYSGGLDMKKQLLMLENPMRFGIQATMF